MINSQLFNAYLTLELQGRISKDYNQDTVNRAFVYPEFKSWKQEKYGNATYAVNASWLAIERLNQCGKCVHHCLYGGEETDGSFFVFSHCAKGMLPECLGRPTPRRLYLTTGSYPTDCRHFEMMQPVERP